MKDMERKRSPPSLEIPSLNFKLDLKWVSLFTMIFQNTLLVLLMRYSRVGNTKLYLTSTAVVMSEFFKLLISLVGMYIEMDNAQMKQGFLEYIRSELIHLDTLKLAVPGLLYTFQNNLLFIALSNLDAAVYQVTYQLKILTTAVFSVILLGKRITSLQTVSLLILFAGVSLVQLSQMPNSEVSNEKEHDSAMLGLFCVLLACMSSGFAGVYLEKILKSGRKVSLFVRNLQLSFFGIVLGLFLSLLNDGGKILSLGFFQNYNRTTWTVVLVQAGSGFVIASVMKYADNILKGFATAISIILSAYLSVFIFDFVISMMFFLGALLVISSVFLYGYTPPKPKADSVTEGFIKSPKQQV